MSMGSQEMLDRADCMSDDFAFEGSDVVEGTTPFVDADLDDLARLLGEDDPDLVVPSPPPFSPASSMSTLSDDMPLVPLGRGVRYFRDDVDVVPSSMQPPGCKCGTCEHTALARASWIDPADIDHSSPF